jgi:hypothetical protein
MVKRDARHESVHAALVNLDAAEIRRRVAVQSPSSPDYVASEVLCSMLRVRFAQGTVVFDEVAKTLLARLFKAVERYFRENPKWDGLLRSSSETLKEAVSHTWAAAVLDKAPVSLAEVRFWPFVEARVLDYLRSQLAQKNQALPLASIGAVDDDGAETPYENTIEGDEEDEPSAVLARKLQSERVNKAYMELDTTMRRAVYFRLECKYDWAKVAGLLGCSVPTARNYYHRGVARLQGAME